MVLDTLPLKQLYVFIRENIVPVGRFIVDPTQVFMNNPNLIIKCANISLCPWSFSNSEFCLVDFLLFDTNFCFKSKYRHYKVLVTPRVVLVKRAKLFRAVIKG